MQVRRNAGMQIPQLDRPGMGCLVWRGDHIPPNQTRAALYAGRLPAVRLDNKIARKRSLNQIFSGFGGAIERTLIHLLQNHQSRRSWTTEYKVMTILVLFVLLCSWRYFRLREAQNMQVRQNTGMQIPQLDRPDARCL